MSVKQIWSSVYSPVKYPFHNKFNSKSARGGKLGVITIYSNAPLLLVRKSLLQESCNKGQGRRLASLMLTYLFSIYIKAQNHLPGCAWRKTSSNWGKRWEYCITVPWSISCWTTRLGGISGPWFSFRQHHWSGQASSHLLLEQLGQDLLQSTPQGSLLLSSAKGPRSILISVSWNSIIYRPVSIHIIFTPWQ